MRQQAWLFLPLWLAPCVALAQEPPPPAVDAPPPPAVDAPPPPRAAPGLFRLSLDELMETEVEIGSLTGTTRLKAPVSLTVIGREQIDVTPARNVADLIETYVPGATADEHIQPRVGLRGVVIDRNYKMLLLVNGKNLNNKSSQGATLELANWDLEDIERIEVIRGPGSVTYGPGAIAGVINIITRDAQTAPGLRLGGVYDVRYRSGGAHAAYGWAGRNVGVFGHLSVRTTKGLERPRTFAVEKDGAHGFYGEDLHPGARPSPYYGDVSEPQVKAHLDLRLFEEARLWARFTSSGMPDMYEGLPYVDYAGALHPGRFQAQRSIAVALEDDHRFPHDVTLKTRLSYDSEHMLQILQGDATRPYNAGIWKNPGDPGNVHYNTAEHELFASALAEVLFLKNYTVALGGSFSYDWLRPTRLFDTDVAGDLAVVGLSDRKDADGRLLQDRVGKGFDSWTGSLMTEANLRFHPLANLMLSGRVDKYRWSDWLFSPRVALVSEVAHNHVIKALWQQSVRTNTLVEQYVEHVQGMRGSPERLMTAELAYSGVPVPNLVIDVLAFYNQLEVLGWDGAKTVGLGDLKILGIEGEARYRDDHWDAGISYAFTKQLEWDAAATVSKQGISYSDYHVEIPDGPTLTGQGNSLHNTPEHVAKVFATWREPRVGVSIHVDMAVYWGYQGRKDGLRMYEAGWAQAGGSAAMDALAKRLDREDYAGPNVMLNASIGYRLPIPVVETTVRLHAQNLLGFKRYFYSSGDNTAYPLRLRWTDEPTTVALKLDLKY